MLSYRATARLFSYRPTAIFFRRVCLNKLVLKTVYQHTHNAKNKFNGLAAEELKEMLEVEVKLYF